MKLAPRQTLRCAGCTVRVNTPDGPAMKRVCVDGPVFDARAVFGYTGESK